MTLITLLLGPYFGDIGGNEWPHNPLHEDPTSLADDFNELLTKLTYEMSNGILKNISLLDLPAFGSTIGTLKKGLKRQFIWPTKVNFAILKSNPAVNRTTIFESYKSLTEDWLNHMEQLDKNHYSNTITLEMKNNRFFNFTKFVMADMKTFLTTISGNNIRLCCCILTLKEILKTRFHWKNSVTAFHTSNEIYLIV